MEKSILHLNDVEEALNRVLMKSDQDLDFLPQNEPVVSKICLVIAVMKKLEIELIHFHPANGNCIALLVAEEFWGNK